MTPFVIVDTPLGLYGFTLSKSIRVSPETNQTVCHQRDSKIWQEPGNFTVEQSLPLIPLVITRAGLRGSYPECEGEAVLHRSRLNAELIRDAIEGIVDTVTRHKTRVSWFLLIKKCQVSFNCNNPCGKYGANKAFHKLYYNPRLN